MTVVGSRPGQGRPEACASSALITVLIGMATVMFIRAASDHRLGGQACRRARPATDGAESRSEGNGYGHCRPGGEIRYQAP